MSGIKHSEKSVVRDELGRILTVAEHEWVEGDVTYQEHAAAIRADSVEVAKLRAKLETVTQAFQDQGTSFSQLREDVKERVERARHDGRIEGVGLAEQVLKKHAGKAQP